MITAEPRIPKVIQADDELGNLTAVAAYMRLSRNFLSAARRAAARLHSLENPTFMRAGFTSKRLVLDWLDRNPLFKPSSEHPR